MSRIEFQTEYWSPCIDIDEAGGTATVTVDGRALELANVVVEAHAVRFTLAGRHWRVPFARDGAHVHVAVAGAAFEWRPSEEAADDAGAHGASDSPDAVAPMPGKVIEVLVDAGQSVSAGDPLVLVEAMKMEQTLRATVAGTVTEIAATAGAMVALGEVLVRVEPDTDD